MVIVENPHSVAKDNILVQRGDVAVKRGSVGFDVVNTLSAHTIVSTPVIMPIKETPMPVLTTAGMSLTTTAAHRVPMGIWVCIVAMGAGIQAIRKSA